jgi:hypothetical protein
MSGLKVSRHIDFSYFAAFLSPYSEIPGPRKETILNCDQLIQSYTIKADGEDVWIYLSTSWRQVVSFTSRPLYPRRKKPLIARGSEAEWPPEQKWTTRGGGISPLTILELRPLGHPQAGTIPK